MATPFSGDDVLERVELEESDDDDIQYETVDIESEEGEDGDDEDLETALRLVREKATEEAKLNAKLHEPQLQKRPEVIDDFIRNFFLKMGLSKSLEAFQIEWYEKLQKKDLRPEDIEVVPDIYLRNQELDNTVKSLRAELEKAKEIAHKARSTWDKFRKERDYHRLNHNRVLQEKKSLVKDLARLKAHLATYEPTLAMLENKYQVAMKEKSVSKLQQDRLQTRIETLEAQLRQSGGTESAVPVPSTRQSSTSASGTKLGGRPKMVSTTGSATGIGMGSSTKDSRLPDEDRANPYLSMTFDPVPVDKFSVKKSFPAHLAPISALAMHPRKSIIATASDDTTWKVWSLPTGDLILASEGHKDWVAGLDFHPQGTHLATASGDATVKLWQFGKEKCVHTFTDHSHAVWACAFHDSGDFLVSSSMDHTIRLWDLNSLRCRLTLRGHVDSVNHVGFQPFSNTICSCSGDKTVSLWDARSGLCTQTFYGHLNSCNHVLFNPTGDTLASTDADGGVRLWDVRMVQERCYMAAGPHPANKCCFDRSGTMLTVASNDSEIKVFNTADGALLSCLTGHQEAVQAVVIERNGKFMVSSGSDNTFKLWS